MAAKKKIKGNTGNRYTGVERRRILDFIEKYDVKHGRGGTAAAVRKFGIPQLTIYRWRKAEGAVVPKTTRKAATKKTAKKATRKAGKKSSVKATRKKAVTRKKAAKKAGRKTRRG